MMARALLVLAAIVLIAASWFVFSNHDRSAAAVAVNGATTVASMPPTIEAPKIGVERTAEGAAAASEASTPAATNLALEITIVGRLLHVDRSPADGAVIALRFEREDERYTVVESKPGPRMTSGVDGRFRLNFAAQSAIIVRLEATLALCATASWSWRELAAGQFVDLGDIVMPSAASLEVRVLDAAGRELATGWSVSVDTPGAGNLSPFANPVHRKLDPLHAAARFDALPVGGVVVAALHDVWVGTPRVSVELRAHETTRVDLRYEGADPSRIINVVARSKPLNVWATLLHEVIMIDPSGKERIVPQRFADASQFLAEGLDSGPYAIEIRDARFKPWRIDGVMPGSQVEATLTANSAIVLSTSLEDPPRELSVNLKWLERPNFAENNLDVVSSTRPLPDDGLVGELFAGDIELTAHARGRVPLKIKLDKLGPNERRRVALEFELGGRIAGRVVHTDHVGVRDVDVRAALRSEDRDNREVMQDDAWAPSAVHVRTGDDGSFEFSGLAGGEWTLRATAAPSVHAMLDIQVAKSGELSGVEILVPALGVLTGHVIAPSDLPLAQLSILTRPVLIGEAKIAFDKLVPEYRPELISGPVHADGSFRCSPVRAGEVDVALAMPRVRRTLGFMASGESRGPLLSLGRVTLPAGGELDRTFDVRDKIPKRAVVHVTVDGAIVPGLPVSAYLHGSNTVAASGDIGENGHTILSWLPEGSYEVYVNALDRSWGDVAPVPLDIKLGESSVFEVNVRFLAGDTELLGVDKQALPDGTRISIVRTGLPSGMQVGADARVQAGRIHLNMPAGSYTLTLAGENHYARASASIEWPSATYAELIGAR